MNLDDLYNQLYPLKSDLQGKISTYNSYINMGKEPPKELEYSINRLQRTVANIESTIDHQRWLEKQFALGNNKSHK